MEAGDTERPRWIGRGVSGFRGVYPQADGGGRPWRAQARTRDGRMVSLGLFGSAIEAAIAVARFLGDAESVEQLSAMLDADRLTAAGVGRALAAVRGQWMCAGCGWTTPGPPPKRCPKCCPTGHAFEQL